MTPWHAFGMGGQGQSGFGRARGTCPEDLLREAAEEQHGAGDIAEAGDEPLVPDVLQLQAVLAALRDLLVLQHLVEDLVRQREVATPLRQSPRPLGMARGWCWGPALP